MRLLFRNVLFPTADISCIPIIRFTHASLVRNFWKNQRKSPGIELVREGIEEMTT